MADGSTGGRLGSAGQSAACPIDHAHLEKYTLGNRPLEIEVLQLFAGQAPETLASLAAAATDKDWHIAAHTMKGSARAVGAWALGLAAEAAEREGRSEPGRSRHLAAIEVEMQRACIYVAGLTA